MKNTKKKGFTIVELVIVIAVIGILSAILIPTFSNLVGKARTAAEKENLHNAYVEYTVQYAATGDYLSQENVVFSAKNEKNETVYYVYDANELTLYKASEVNKQPTKEGYKLVKIEAENKTFNGYDAYSWEKVTENA